MSLVGEKPSFTIDFTEEQEQLLEVATSLCRDKAPMEKVRQWIETEEGFDKALWGEMASLGWLGISIPESYGGSALGLGEVVAVAEPMGRHLLPSPFFATTLAARLLMAGGTKEQKEAWLPKINEGSIATVALHEPHGDWDLENLTCRAEEKKGEMILSGQKSFVMDAAAAEMIVISLLFEGAPACLLIESASLPEGALSREIVIDETKRSYGLNLEGIRVPASQLLERDKTKDALKDLHHAALLLLSAEMCGGLSGTLDITVDYLNTRKQFERFIGAYQALKHPTVDMLTGWDMARSHLYYAASKPGGTEGAMIAARMAKAAASDAFAFGTDRAIQFHGGFGFTYECDAQLYRRRAFWGEYLHGDAAWQRALLAKSLIE